MSTAQSKLFSKSKTFFDDLFGGRCEPTSSEVFSVLAFIVSYFSQMLPSSPFRISRIYFGFSSSENFPRQSFSIIFQILNARCVGSFISEKNNVLIIELRCHLNKLFGYRKCDLTFIHFWNRRQRTKAFFVVMMCGRRNKLISHFEDQITWWQMPINAFTQLSIFSISDIILFLMRLQWFLRFG